MVARSSTLIARVFVVSMTTSHFALAGAPACGPFVRGDVDGNRSVNLTDGVDILNALFAERSQLACADAADANDDGRVNMSDAVFLLGYLFRDEVVALPPPFAACGGDPTPDALGCARPLACAWNPPAEICDGIDNDCDGDVDEGHDTNADADNCGACGFRCADQGGPNVAEYGCLVGICFIRRCEAGYFDVDGIVETGCEARSGDNGTPCNDRNPCTVGDRYFQGVCGGAWRDCSHLDDDCFAGECDRVEGCVAVPRPIRTPCDDGDPDTWADQCDGRGVCQGVPIPEL